MTRYLSIAEAADLLELAPKTLHRQCRRGKLKAEKFGRMWKIEAKEVRRYARENKRKGKG